MTNLTRMQRLETVSVLVTAARNGCVSADLPTVAGRYARNAYGVDVTAEELADMCQEAEQLAGEPPEGSSDDILELDESPEPPAGTSYCEACHKSCDGHWEDFGIGAYECHGRRGVDVCMAFVSECCEATVMLDGQPYEPPDLREEHGNDDMGEPYGN